MSKDLKELEGKIGYKFDDFTLFTKAMIHSSYANEKHLPMEALIGAIYLDGGFANAKEFIHRFILKDLENKKLFFDSKTILQEIVQANFKEVISYHLIGEEGPDHNKIFRVAVHIGEEEYGVGEGRTKKAAEQEAAYISILKLHEKNIK